MPDASAASTTRRVSIGQRLDGGSAVVTTTDGYCTCREPLTDTLVDARRIGDDDDDGGVCWRCRRPIREA